MKEKTKKIILGYLPGFITGIIICGTISVIAATYFPSNDVTYDNTASGLSSTDVQGAIDELYGVCTKEPTAGDSILDNTDIVTSGDGLYEDEYEDGRYFYKGGNPNNYIYFNCTDINNQSSSTCDIWRIISIDSDKTIKIIREESIGNQVWDSSNSNNWVRPASLNTYLNGTYYNGLNSTAKSQIVAKDWSIGAITNGNLSSVISKENSTKWNGKISLVTASEYIRSNSNKSSCELFDSNYNMCNKTTWMNFNEYWWALSSDAGDYRRVFLITSYGNVESEYAHGSFAVRPVVYLSSEVKITGGTGSQSNPYTIA